MITIEQDVPFAGFARNLRLGNGEVDLVLATEYGPRLMGYGPRNGPNLLGQVSPALQGNDTPFGDRWHIYGGHRLWHAPEHAVRTYWPDNVPVNVAMDADQGRVTLTQVLEPHTLLEKSIEVTLAPRGSGVSLVHRLVNRGAFDIELAAWALTVMAQGGRAIFPQAPFVPHPVALAPARPLVLWPFTRMNDPRWTWGDRFIMLRQDPARREPQKVGLYDQAGWMAYQLGTAVFVKRHQPQPGLHADFGCNVQTFTNDAILELETLSPVSRIPPGGQLVHREQWSFHLDTDLGNSEQSMAEAMAALLGSGRGSTE
jgi:hypothetical protein